MNAQARTLLATLALCAPLCTLAAAPADDSAARDLTARFVAAWNRHDAGAMAATYAAAGSLVDPFRAMHGRAEVEKGFAGLHAGPARDSSSQMLVGTIERLRADLILADASQTVTGMLDPDGKPLPPMKFAVTMVIEQNQGQWAYRAVRVVPAPPAP